ncbi:MAG: DUF1638 domain-containing protein [Gammaproteobacteria bacterium]|nr:DUF1638 domain-containing protein [Gammaproteobacteria bacterium]MDE2264250.1 DUF1638 domain-containing protein [Gammaproteobacteria bacterium]
MDTSRGTLIIACGALAHEIAALRKANGWSAIDVCCLPPELHNRPDRIAPAVREKIRAHRGEYRSLFVAYGDCGTGGRLDALLREEGVERLPGAHCYEFFAGARAFAEMADVEPGTFYLTDFLTRHFERLVVRGLGIDRHPQLAQEYFRNYRKVIYLAQTDSPALLEQARQIASGLGLAFEHRCTGFGELGSRLTALAAADRTPVWQT